MKYVKSFILFLVMFSVSKTFFAAKVDFGSLIEAIQDYSDEIESSNKSKIAVCDNFKNIERLIDSVPDINQRDEFGRTLLHYAAECNDLRLINKLLMHKYININIQDNDGRTPIYISVARGKLHNTNLLLGKGAKWDILAIGTTKPSICKFVIERYEMNRGELYDLFLQYGIDFFMQEVIW